VRLDPATIALRERIEELEETIRQLRTRPKDIPVWPGLRLAECVLVHALSTRAGLCTRDYLLGRLKALSDCRDPSDKAVNVYICRSRKKLARLDPAIVIRTVVGEGYWMDADSRARVGVAKSAP
jgi:DNA-binding response OmpR family regulator